MLRRVLPIVLLICSAPVAGQVVPPPPGASIDVLRYGVALRPDLETSTVGGIETVRFIPKDDMRTIEFSPNALEVVSAAIDNKPVDVSSTDKAVTFTSAQALPKGREATLRVIYRGLPKRGLAGKDGALYASYFACDWMFCLQNSPGDKAWFDLDLYLPKDAVSLGVGRKLSTVSAGDGLTVHSWRLARPYSPYLFGFAAGRLKLVEQEHSGTHFTFASAGVPDADLSRMFADTFAISDFFAAKAGFPIVDSRYTQILVPGYEAQEEATFSLIGSKALDDDLREPQSQWIIAHELAHQWWGNLVTCATWQDFWLNEGFATFMTAAWKQFRFGEQAYQAELDGARKKLKRAADLGYDKPLAWGGTYPNLGVRRDIQYSKGALFLDYLRSELGEQAFWKGIRQYTTRFAGKTVRSSDFEKAMSQASGRDLSAIFSKWVYGDQTAAQP